MTNAQRQPVIDLGEGLSGLLKYDSSTIYSREEWGSKLTFHDYQEDFERLFGLVRIFLDLPYELLPDAQLNQIIQVVTAASAHLASIDAFDSSIANNPQQTITALGNQVKIHADAVTVQMAQWISYLAYQKGDVSSNISSLESAIGQGEKLVAEAKGRIEKEEGEIKRIVQQAQDFAGDKGVTIFTQQFDTEAGNNKTEAKNWLKATVGVFTLTTFTLSIFMYQLTGVSNWYEWLSRAALIGVLITAGAWCSKNYRILRHQEAVNRHKANGLKSFLLFRDAADNDEATRNAVLMETTRSIFATPDSGFVQQGNNAQASEIRILDGARAAVAATKTSRSVE
ncbi:MAG: hypothetical protein COA71_01075 [SAR86 cluster bacterium]|uniref:Uncharacterized protein n=1 Tax=SAR86 cluster bacterium TaxID=2030880 RepID=A0A2A5CJ12_9GAMM|nr:hypothetical protein [Gammaproteobacteria bacterium AH-315-E17]PCJ43495.1 MAG: hypothetical protein COA71_01075 [SAR86 cluster bacterium]